MTFKKTAALCLSTVLMCTTLSGCGTKDYADYAAAYNKVTAKGGLNAQISYSVTMDDGTSGGNGELKMDSSSNNMYYEMNMDDGSKVIQFTDGSYLYTDNGEAKKKFSLDDPTGTEEKNAEEEPEKRDDDEGAPEFDTQKFVEEFAEFMEVGKIREMGLLNAIPSAVVSKTEYKDDTYTLTLNADTISKVMISVEEGNGETDVPSVSNIKNLTYTATEKDGMISRVKMTGSVDVTVPGSLMTNGKDASYSLTFSIQITFVDGGKAITVTLPSTDGYTT